MAGEISWKRRTAATSIGWGKDERGSKLNCHTTCTAIVCSLKCVCVWVPQCVCEWVLLCVCEGVYYIWLCIFALCLTLLSSAKNFVIYMGFWVSLSPSPSLFRTRAKFMTPHTEFCIFALGKLISLAIFALCGRRSGVGRKNNQWIFIQARLVN